MPHSAGLCIVVDGAKLDYCWRITKQLGYPAATELPRDRVPQQIVESTLVRSITRRFVIRLSLLIAYFAFLQLGGMGSVGAHEFALKGGANVVKLTLATGEPVRMEMELKPYRPGLLGRPFTRDAWWGSRDGGAPLPDKVIWSMRLSVNGKPAVLPQSAFDYLTNCNALDLHEDHGGITAILSGGDAGEGYNVEWRFTYSKVLACYVLRSRRVHYGEFPEVHENTDYTYNENKDL